MKALLCAALLFSLACSCKQKVKVEETTSPEVTEVTVAPFGKMKDGPEVNLYTLKNKNGIEMGVMNFGGIITTLKTPDKAGVFQDVVLGLDSLSQYENHRTFFGALVGRYGNRIAKGKFTLDGKPYTLAVNNGENHLHGGLIGFDKVYWNIEILNQNENPSLKLTYTSKDMEEGYPGTLKVTVIYTLTEENEVKIQYSAETDKKTIVNLTNHTYFNLTGNTKRDILDHQLVLRAERFIPVDKGLIPTGELKSVDKTPFDFRTPQTIGSRISEKDPQLIAGIGYDHGYVIEGSAGELRPGGSVYEPVSGRFMEFSTTEPAVQFYSGNFLDGKLTGKYGVVYQKRYALCLETEHYPDSPNQPSFPSVVLEPGKTFHSETVYKFGVK